MPCEGDHGRSRLRRRILGTVSRRLHFQDCGHARRGGERLVETEALVNEFHESTTDCWRATFYASGIDIRLPARRAPGGTGRRGMRSRARRGRRSGRGM
jgi:hypothetical protein